MNLNLYKSDLICDVEMELVVFGYRDERRTTLFLYDVCSETKKLINITISIDVCLQYAFIFSIENMKLFILIEHFENNQQNG